MTRDDRDEMLRMRLALWPDSTADDLEAEMPSWLKDESRLIVFVAEREGGGLAGFVEAGIRDVAEDCETRDVGYVEGWYVDGDARLRGVGRMLVGAAEDWARSRGCVEMASDCLLTNEVSLAAHLRLGYEETARLIHFRKRLDNPSTE
ncbi:MAG TPA: aminoglycoside 6'-N-acetyltransferase [Pyrinomonadaceae bacterium]|nr:aminoglycoside 6'-N-acetyltransferase [Pyrinomonadaceae bacterium]